MNGERKYQTMDNKLPIISYTLATLSSLCFIGGLVLLSDKGGKQDVPTRGDIINVGQKFEH